MNRKELMRAIAVATGVAVGTAMSMSPVAAAHKTSHSPAASEKANPQGFAKSGNPKAAGGPQNPGKGNPFNAY